MKTILLALALLSLSVPATAQPAIGPAPYVALAVGAGLDLATTLDALHVGRGTEGNPLLSHGGTPGLVGMKVASTVAVAYLLKRVAPGHPKAARTLGYVVGAVLTGVAAHNYGVGR